MNDDPEHIRHLALEGASNFRDFGAYPTPDGQVKARHLYRSDRLSRLTAGDYRLLNDRGIRLVVDLRRESERRAEPTRWSGGPKPEQLHAPLLADQDGPSPLRRVVTDPQSSDGPARAAAIMTELYRQLILEPFARQRYRTIFQQLAVAENLPVLIHCSGGKDRTGVLAALILGALGVSREDIVEDFMLTTRFYDGLTHLQERAAQVFQYESEGWSTEALIPVFTVQRGYIEAALDAAEAGHGSVRAYLVQEVGIERRIIDRLREHLVE